MVDLKVYFKFICVIGICLSAISLFFEWYSFQVFSWEGDLVALWEFNLFSGWHTPFSPDNWFNSAYEPDFLPIPLIIHIIYLSLMLISLFSIISINLNDPKKLTKSKKYSYVYLSSILISGYYICIVPVYFFIIPRYFFPYLTFTDPEFVVIEYGVAVGYWFQCFAFACMFPYMFYFAVITMQFERAPEPFEKKLNSILKKVLIPIDFHQLIAEERLELENHNSFIDSQDTGKDIFEQFIKRRGVS